MRRRWFVLFLSLLLLWLLLAQVNHYLAVRQVYIFAGGLFVTYAALKIPLRSGLAVTVLAGLLFDANSAATFGTHVLLFAATHAVIYHLRDRVPRDQTTSRVIVTLLANLALFLLLSFGQVGQSPAPAAIWPRLIFDLACSQVLIVIIAPWFFALQTSALTLAGAENRSLY